jgi:predicted transcriptional regulator of viral defense system
MQPMKLLTTWLVQHADSEHYLFTLKDIAALFPELSNPTIKTLMSRAVRANYLVKICRGIYLYKQKTIDGLILFHVASLLRADNFNYISLETALSEAGVISQIPINRITIMSPGRSNAINCSGFGTIEFIHTTQKPKQIMDQLSYDNKCKLWRANVSLALRDMKATRRNLDLIDEGSINEFI